MLNNAEYKDRQGLFSVFADIDTYIFIFFEIYEVFEVRKSISYADRQKVV